MSVMAVSVSSTVSVLTATELIVTHDSIRHRTGKVSPMVWSLMSYSELPGSTMTASREKEKVRGKFSLVKL